MIRVLLVDDDRRLFELLEEYMTQNGVSLTYAPDGKTGLEKLRPAAQGGSGGAFDAVLLDVMMPQVDGLEVLRRIRTDSRIPVLMLTARGDEADRIVGLEIGADDYLPKTFSTRELLARLRAVTRRSARTRIAEEPAPEELVVGPLRISPETRAAWVEDAALDLTPVEFDLLVSLARAKGRVRSREALLEEARDRNYDVFDRSIDVHISALRKKLGDDPKSPRFIRTYRGAGYMLINPEAS